jgi:biotin carboxyl carrier protein
MNKRVYLGEQAVDLETNADITEVEPGVYSVLKDGRSFVARVVAGRPGAFSVDIGGASFAAEVRDPRDLEPHSRKAQHGGRQTIAASMPGKVIRVLVEVGQMVEAGQGIVVVEAMKMQNAMKAAKPGKVVQIQTRDGDTVRAGDVLAVIE